MQKITLKNHFLFGHGEIVMYNKTRLPLRIEGMKRRKHHLLSECNGRNVYENVYDTVFHSSLKYVDKTSRIIKEYMDEEQYLTSYDQSKPKGAVDYESDEFAASFLDKNGKILKTIKSGKPGHAHNIVRDALFPN